MRFNRDTVLAILVIGSLFFVALTAFTKYLLFKDYTFLIEAACDPEEQICYTRSCEDYCPPNGLEVFTVYEISASNFDSCTDNSCASICRFEQTASLCTEIFCEPSDDVTCSE